MRKTVQNAIEICYSKQCVSASGGLPQTPYRGSAPGPHWRTSVPRPPRMCSSKIPLKIPCTTHCCCYYCYRQ